MSAVARTDTIPSPTSRLIALAPNAAPIFRQTVKKITLTAKMRLMGNHSANVMDSAK